MSYCHVSRQIDDYIHGEMVVDAFYQALNKRIEELTEKEGEFYPFSKENVFEALGGLNDNQELILAAALENSADNIGGMLAAWIDGYWILQAEKKAIAELSK